MPKGQKRKQNDADIIDLSGDDLETGAKPKPSVRRKQKSSKGQAEKRVDPQGLPAAAHFIFTIVYMSFVFRANPSCSSRCIFKIIALHQQY